jgi:hypothetical protein
MKHSADPALYGRLPEIFSLWDELLRKHTGLEMLETIGCDGNFGRKIRSIAN